MLDFQEIYKEIGERLRQVRESRGLSQEQIGAALGINPKIYAKYEAATKRIPIKVVIKLAEYYDVNMDYLLCLKDEAKPYKSM